MTWTTRIFAYCERGLDAGLWAEPLNALSSLAFLAAAIAGYREWTRAGTRHSGAAGRTTATLALVLLAAAIGVGSILFHTVATRWARLADTAPIGIFMLGYLAFALIRLLRLDAATVAGAMLAFMVSLGAAGAITCAGAPCYNGSLAYAPALVALAAVGLALARRRHPAAPALLLAAALFLPSLALRTVDLAACPYTIVAARAVGTHFLWHLVNALALWLLLRAAIRHDRPALTAAPRPAAARSAR